MAARRRRRAARQPEDDPNVRREATRAIGHAVRSLKQLRVIYIGDAALMGIALLFVLRTDATGLAVAIGACAILAVLGAILVVQQPVLWTVLLALAHSIPGVLALIAIIAGIVTLGTLLTVTLSVLLWMAVKMAIGLQRILQEYPDVWAARRVRGRGRRGDEMDSRWRDDARERRKRSITTALVVGGVAVAAIVVAVIVSNGGGRCHGYSLRVGVGWKGARRHPAVHCRERACEDRAAAEEGDSTPQVGHRRPARGRQSALRGPRPMAGVRVPRHRGLRDAAHLLGVGGRPLGRHTDQAQEGLMDRPNLPRMAGR